MQRHRTASADITYLTKQIFLYKHHSCTLRETLETFLDSHWTFLIACTLLCIASFQFLSSNMSRKCLNSSDSFCYICGEYTLKSSRATMTPLVKKAYKLYFGCKIGDQDKTWAPHICCVHCAVNLRAWLNGNRPSMPFAVPMIWREQKDHVTDCYFCLTRVSGYSKKNKKAITYPNLPLAIIIKT